MAHIPAGEFWMGCGEEAVGMEDCRPRHRVFVKEFWIDSTPVTNKDFSAFVRRTGYVTLAERPIDPAEAPGASKEALAPGSLVFRPTQKPVPLSDSSQWWSFVRGASWRHPEGPDSGIRSRSLHPVVHIAWADAEAYCRWKGKRLPSEAEYERAARGGLDRKRFAWGNEFLPHGQRMANTWQGRFPVANNRRGALVRTSPVKSFPPNGFGLFDMAGNVWEWTSDWYRPDYFQQLAREERPAANPQGPAESLDPAEPGVLKRVQKGGSFLCSPQFCSRFLVGTRGRAEPKSSASHTGFRCVADSPIRASENAPSTGGKNEESKPEQAAAVARNHPDPGGDRHESGSRPTEL